MTLLDDLLISVGAHRTSSAAERDAILHRVSPAPTFETEASDRALVRMADLLEASALAAPEEAREAGFSRAFSCWAQVDTASGSLRDMYDYGYAPESVALAFHIGVTGILAKRPSEAQHALTQTLPSARELETALAASDDRDWRTTLLHDVMLASVLLVRKADGWADIRLALRLMQGLREKQGRLEADYLHDVDEQRADVIDLQVYELVACYHVAQLVTTTGTYIQSGAGGAARVRAQLGRHTDQAIEAAELIRDGVLARIVRLVSALSLSLVQSSIWTQLTAVSSSLSGFAAALASSDIDKPLLDLWPSQQEALRSNFLDPYSRAVLVEMPTSAGKTLLAKISIVQTLALNPESTIAYVVPTRVLVNQVVDDLRYDLRPLGYDVEQAVPVFELDPTESAMLSRPPRVLVTTAEKLDLLLREDHPAVANLSQIIVDEAHNLNDGLRGARLELLLATIKRDRPDARFLLMSPFLPEAEQLVEWLGDERGLQPIEVSWQPNRRLVVAIESVRRRNHDYALVLKSVSASANEHVEIGTEIELRRTNERITSLEKLSLDAAASVRHRGGVTLVLCYGKATSMKRAETLAEGLPPVEPTDLLEAVVAHLKDELGSGNPLGPLLHRGVAYHHAGMSLESRKLVERLIRDGVIHTVCGTSTLSQGVNFPINNVIIESLRKGRGGTLTHADFWNTAGRAGRGRLSDLGLVAFPVADSTQRARWDRFLQGEAEAVASQLAGLVDAVDTLGDDFNFRLLKRHETLSPFMQYLAHAMKVSGAAEAARDVEDLMRNSLVYQQAQSLSPEAAARLVRLCRRYLQHVANKPGLVALADGTGFSTTTIEALRARSHNTAVATVQSWEPSTLFGTDLSGLTERVQMLGDLPEMRLGTDVAGSFNAERVAATLTDWVNGVSMEEMVARYGDPQKEGYARSSGFASYLYSSLVGQASWGMGALQRVAWAGRTGETSGDAVHIPSMLFFGVRSKEAIWMRMAGLPRTAATRISSLWAEQGQGAPESYGQLRDFISGVSPAQWEQRRGTSAVSGAQMKLLWTVLG